MYTQQDMAAYLQHSHRFLQKFIGTVGARYDILSINGKEQFIFKGSKDDTVNFPHGDTNVDKVVSEDEAEAKRYLRLKKNYYDQQNADFSTHSISPRAGLVYQPTPDHTLKLLHGWAFRNPTVRERFSASSSRIPIGEKLNPEKIYTTELGFGWRVMKRILWETDTFFSRAVDIIQLGSSRYHRSGKKPEVSLSQYQNADQANLLGGEMKVDALIYKSDNFNLSLFGNYSYQYNQYIGVNEKEKGTSEAAGTNTNLSHDTAKIEDITNDEDVIPRSSTMMPRVATHKANTGLTAYLFKKLIVSPRVNFVGSRPNVITSQVEFVDAYMLFHLNLAYLNVVEGMDFQMFFFNILNTKAEDPGVRSADGYYAPLQPLPGFSVWARLSVKI